MNKEILNFQPSQVEYVLPDEIDGQFPEELDLMSLEGDALMGEKPLASKRDIMNFIGRHFVATFPSDEFALRKLTEDEQKIIRSEYCSLTEDLLPVRGGNN